MKYYIKFPLWARIALIALVVASIAQIAWSVLRLLSLWGLQTAGLGIEITTIVGMILVITVTLLLYTARFRTRNNILTLKIAGISILSSTILIENILNVVYYTNTDKMYIGYVENDGSTNILHINIYKKAMKKFVEELQSINNNIYYSEELA